MSKTLIVLAHFDDESISCPQYLLDHPGSTILIVCGNDPDRINAFNTVVDVTLCHAMFANYKPFEVDQSKIPYLARLIETSIRVGGFDRVITHHPLDIHQDHRIVNQSVQIALRRHKNVELFYVKNPEGFPFENVTWDTKIKMSELAKNLVFSYEGINYPPERDFELYQTVRRFSI